MNDLRSIPIAHLVPSEDNVRTEPDPEACEEGEYIDKLADSIQANGLLHALAVRRVPGSSERYEVLAGLRRLEALKLLGHEVAPCRVLSQEVDAFRLSFEENMQRTQMTQKEKCLAIQRFLNENDHNVDMVARCVNLSANTVRRYAKVATLNDAMLDRLDAHDETRLTLKDAQTMAERLLQAAGGPAEVGAAMDADAASAPLPITGANAANEAAGQAKKPRKKPLKSQPWIYDREDTPVAIPPALYPDVYRLVLQFQAQNHE